METYLIRSSCVPFVRTTSPQRRSLKAIPLRVPPQAAKSQSETILGTPSPRTSWINPFLLSGTPAEPADFLNASPIRFNSLSDTVNYNGINNSHTVTLTSLYFRIPKCKFYYYAPRLTASSYVMKLGFEPLAPMSDQITIH